MRFKGVIPALGTPLKEGDRVDEGGLRRLVRYLLDAGVDGLFANGTMGGFAFLTDQEQLRAISIVVSEVAGEVPVIAGTAETGTRRATEKARDIAALGPNALSLLPPFYYRATQENLRSYFSDVVSAVDLPVVLYDNPFMTNNHVEPATVEELHQQHANIVGIKVSNQDCVNLQDLLFRLGDTEGFSVLTGSEHLLLVGLQMGCDGCVGGVYNVCPHIPVQLLQAFREGNIARARELQQQLIEVWQIFAGGNIWGAFDEAMRYLELCERGTGQPYVSHLAEEEEHRIRAILDRHVKPYRLIANLP